jgi:hypothetical protein
MLADANVSPLPLFLLRRSLFESISSQAPLDINQLYEHQQRRLLHGQVIQTPDY